MHENKPIKSHKYAPIKEIKQNKTNKHNLNLPMFASGIPNAHDMLKIIIPTDLSQFNT